MENKHTAIVEKTNTGYSAYIKDLNGIATTGSDLKELEKNLTEALNLYYNNNNFTFTMEEETINNYEFDLAYEDYKGYVNSLKAVYFRLIYNFPNHERVKFWQKRQEYWKNYDLINLGYKAFDSIETLEAEITKIHPESILADDLETTLHKLNKASEGRPPIE